MRLPYPPLHIPLRDNVNPTTSSSWHFPIPPSAVENLQSMDKLTYEDSTARVRDPLPLQTLSWLVAKPWIYQGQELQRISLPNAHPVSMYSRGGGETCLDTVYGRKSATANRSVGIKRLTDILGGRANYIQKNYRKSNHFRECKEECGNPGWTYRMGY